MKLPKISIITPSFNQATFLERTILSVLNQGYPNLEYIIIDGGSNDDTVSIIRKYSRWLSWWASQPDRGQVDAINRGLRLATGEWVAWQNSDDIYFPGTFYDLVSTASKYPKAELIAGDLMLIDEHDRHIREVRYIKPSYNALRSEGMLIANQAAFWRRGLHERLGWLDEQYDVSFDYEWFLRCSSHLECIHAPRIWGALRLHGDTKTSQQSHKFDEENQRILAGRQLPSCIKSLYKIRRVVLMLCKGQLVYILKGIRHRVRRYRGVSS